MTVTIPNSGIRGKVPDGDTSGTDTVPSVSGILPPLADFDQRYSHLVAWDQKCFAPRAFEPHGIPTSGNGTGVVVSRLAQDRDRFPEVVEPELMHRALR